VAFSSWLRGADRSARRFRPQAAPPRRARPGDRTRPEPRIHPSPRTISAGRSGTPVTEIASEWPAPFPRKFQDEVQIQALTLQRSTQSQAVRIRSPIWLIQSYVMPGVLRLPQKLVEASPSQFVLHVTQQAALEVVDCNRKDEFTLVSKPSTPRTAHELVCSYRELPSDLKPGETVLFADGTVAMTVVDTRPGRGQWRVARGVRHPRCRRKTADRAGCHKSEL